MYYVKFRIWVTGELCYSLEYNVDALNVKWKDHLSKETIMKRKRKAFVKVFKKLSWFLLISGLGLILACWSWSQIRVSGLGRDNNHSQSQSKKLWVTNKPNKVDTLTFKSSIQIFILNQEINFFGFMLFF